MNELGKYLRQDALEQVKFNKIETTTNKTYITLQNASEKVMHEGTAESKINKAIKG